MILPSVKIASDYLHRHIQPSGRFDYEYNPVTGTVSNDYNLIRHAGTLYALYQVGDKVSNTDKALSYLDDKYIENGKALSGFAGLLCIAVIERHKICPTDSNLNSIKFLASSIISFQNGSGDFAHDHVVGKELVYKDNGKYYPGQCILALASILKLYRDEKIKLSQQEITKYTDSAKRGADFIMQRDWHKKNSAICDDQWNAIAFSLMEELFPDCGYRTYANRIADGVIGSDYVQQIDNPQINKNFTCANIATRIEGLAAIAMMEANAGCMDFAHDLLSDCLKLQSFAKKFQYTSGNGLGGYAFAKNNPTIRIDVVQHMISANLSIDALALKLNRK